MPNHTGVTFDPVAAAEAATQATVRLLLNPQRAARLFEYHARDGQNPDFYEVLNDLTAAVWKEPTRSGLTAQIEVSQRHVLVNELLLLAVNKDASSQVRSAAQSTLEHIKDRRDPYSTHLIEMFERNPEDLPLSQPVEMPPGQPIGEDDFAAY
jgi:hypothetical protein